MKSERFFSVDVSRGIRDPTGNVEKVINIYGTPENSSKACAKILEVVHREMQKDPINQGKTLVYYFSFRFLLFLR